jgi:hypothetical protein
VIAGLLKVLVKVMVAAAVAAVVLTIAGDSLRQFVPEAYHRVLWVAGLCISVPCAVGVLLVRTSAPARVRLENLLLVGAALGGLFCLLFITGVDCELKESHGRRTRFHVSCRDVE